MNERQHEWDLLVQAHPATPKPFGYVCECGELVVEGFSSPRDALRAARAHAQRVAERPAA